MRVLIIAEAGVNHNGDLCTAKELVKQAAIAGADFVKFQTFIPENVVTRFAQKAEYQQENTGGNSSQLEMIREIQLSQADHQELIKCCEKYKIKFLSAPFDLESVDFLQELGMPFWKIPSGEITNYPYLVRIARTGKDIILSTGMSNLKEIHDAVNLLMENKCGKITLLQCNTEYPTPFADVNLNAMFTLKKEFGLDVGYSDHTVGIEAAIAAVAMGAVVIEKHFTLDKKMTGPDHKASLEPNELAELVRAIRNVELAMGSGIKISSHSEEKNINIARKSIIAKCKIKKDDIFSLDNLTTKRPGNGISPMRWNEIIGQRSQRDFDEDELIDI